MTNVRCWMALFIAACALPAFASVTYTYRSPNFNEFWGNPPYTTASHISGTFTLAAPLPANLPQSEISSQLLGYSFTDGFQTRTPSNTQVCARELYGFRVSTDASGRIVTWAITLCSPVTAAADPLTAIITIHGFASAINEDEGISEATCDFLRLGSCASMTSTKWGRRLNGNDETSWSIQAETADVGASIPALNELSLAALIAALLGVGLVALRRREHDDHCG